jgi:hypothetical protein
MYEEKKTQVQRKSKATALRVVATFEMDTATFVRHFNGRHHEELSGMQGLPENMDYRTEQAYRAYHRRLHLQRLPHFHDVDPPEAGIDRAIELIIENRDWGWKEIADVYGFVAAFPNGQLATRVDGTIIYHGDISEATDRLVAAGKLAKKNIVKASKQ